MNLAASCAPMQRRLMNTLSASATGSILLLGANSPAQGSAELFASKCSGCHDNAVHPRELVYNAAGNAAIITAVNAAGMGATGSPADNISIATYLDGVKPTITLAPVAHDSPGTVISIRDIKVSAAVNNASLKIIAEIATVSAPTKGTVTYRWHRLCQSLDCHLQAFLRAIRHELLDRCSVY